MIMMLMMNLIRDAYIFIYVERLKDIRNKTERQKEKLIIKTRLQQNGY